MGTTVLSGCDRLAGKPWFRRLLDRDEDANLYVQRLLLSQRELAPEYSAAEISPWFKPNGTSDPTDRDYKALVKAGFKEFHLVIDGLVDTPQRLSLADLRSMPARTQITRHDCVEGWSCIGQWTGVPLATLLQKAGLKPQARFVVLFCADTMDEGSGLDSLDETDDQDDSGDAKADGGKNAKANMPAGDPPARQPDGAGAGKVKGQKGQTGTPLNPNDPGSRYYESIDLEDAFHPQTILAYDMNGAPLPVAHGAPLRLRVERQLGYKMAKYVMRISLVEALEGVGKGGGGYWEDNGYEWYAGI